LTFSLSPKEYLAMLQDQIAEYEKEPLSLRKAITVSVFANHLSEFVFAAYDEVEPAKLGGDLTKARYRERYESYRESLEAAKPELKLLRDVCDFGKHAILKRGGVDVAATSVARTLVPRFQGLLALTNHTEEDKIVVTLADNDRVHLFESLIREVVNFWQSLFAEKKL
jgi:hypothetical protein